MCCGSDGPAESEIVMAAAGRAEGSMAKVFLTSTAKGAKVRIGTHGEATFDTPCEVPEEVAQELEAWMAGEAADPEKGIRGRSPSSEYRIEREVPAAPAAAPKKARAAGQEE